MTKCERLDSKGGAVRIFENNVFLVTLWTKSFLQHGFTAKT